MKRHTHHTVERLPTILQGARHFVVGELALFAESAGEARRACLVLGPRAGRDRLGYVKMGDRMVYYIPKDDVDNPACYRTHTATTSCNSRVLKYTAEERHQLKRGAVRPSVSVNLRQRRAVDHWWREWAF